MDNDEIWRKIQRLNVEIKERFDTIEELKRGLVVDRGAFLRGELPPLKQVVDRRRVAGEDAEVFRLAVEVQQEEQRRVRRGREEQNKRDREKLKRLKASFDCELPEPPLG